MRVNRKRTQHHVRCLLCLLGGDEVDAAATHALGSRDRLLILRRTTSLPASSIRTRGCSGLLGAIICIMALLVAREASNPGGWVVGATLLTRRRT